MSLLFAVTQNFSHENILAYAEKHCDYIFEELSKLDINYKLVFKLTCYGADVIFTHPVGGRTKRHSKRFYIFTCRGCVNVNYMKTYMDKFVTAAKYMPSIKYTYWIFISRQLPTPSKPVNFVLSENIKMEADDNDKANSSPVQTTPVKKDEIEPMSQGEEADEEEKIPSSKSPKSPRSKDGKLFH